MRKQPSALFAVIRETIASPIEFDAILAKAGARDRTNIERHVTLSGEQRSRAHAELYKRLLRVLGTLAPLPVQTLGQQTVMFFVADGKYRMQVFAMEDAGDGKIVIYAPDALAEAARVGVLAGRGGEEGYTIAAAPDELLPVDSLTAANTPNPPAHVKNMLGWNRKAVRITLSESSTENQVEAAESLAAVAGRPWTASAATAAAAPKVEEKAPAARTPAKAATPAKAQAAAPVKAQTAPVAAKTKAVPAGKGRRA